MVHRGGEGALAQLSGPQASVACSVGSCRLEALVTREGQLRSSMEDEGGMEEEGGVVTPAASCLERSVSGQCWRLCGPRCKERKGNCPGTWSPC